MLRLGFIFTCCLAVLSACQLVAAAGNQHEAYFQQHMRMLSQYLMDVRGDDEWSALNSDGKEFARCFYRSFPLKELYKERFTAEANSWAPANRAKRAFEKNQFPYHQKFDALETFFETTLREKNQKAKRRRHSSYDDERRYDKERRERADVNDARKERDYNEAFRDGLLSAWMTKIDAAPMDWYVPGTNWNGERTVWLPALNSAQFALGNGQLGDGYQQYGLINRTSQTPAFAAKNQYVYFRSQGRHCTPQNLASAAEWKVIKEVAARYIHEGNPQTSAARLAQLAAEVSARSPGRVSIQDRTTMIRYSADYLKTLYRSGPQYSNQVHDVRDFTNFAFPSHHEHFGSPFESFNISPQEMSQLAGYSYHDFEAAVAFYLLNIVEGACVKLDNVFIERFVKSILAYAEALEPTRQAINFLRSALAVYVRYIHSYVSDHEHRLRPVKDVINAALWACGLKDTSFWWQNAKQDWWNDKMFRDLQPNHFATIGFVDWPLEMLASEEPRWTGMGADIGIGGPGHYQYNGRQQQQPLLNSPHYRNRVGMPVGVNRPTGLEGVSVFSGHDTAPLGGIPRLDAEGYNLRGPSITGRNPYGDVGRGVFG